MATLTRRFISLMICLLLMATIVFPVLAQSAPTVDMTIDDTGFPELTTTVTVLNSKGVPESGLTESAFKLQEDGHPLKVESIQTIFQNDRSPLALALVMDLSGNITGQNLKDAKAAAQAVVDQMTATDQLAIWSPGQTAAAFTSDKATLRSRVDGLTNVSSATPLYDPTFEAIQKLNQQAKTPTRRAVILMTDGTDSGSSTKVDDLIREATNDRIPIFTVALGNKADAKNLERIALTTTGGPNLTAKDTTELRTRFQEVFKNMKLSYQIAARSQLGSDDSKHTLGLNVTLPGGSAQASGEFGAPRPDKPQIIKVEYTDQGQTYPLKDGLELKGVVTLVPTIASKSQIAKVEYIVDDKTNTPVGKEPWTYDWSTCGLEPGAHTLRIRATDDQSQADERVFNLTTQKGGLLVCGVGPLTPTMLLVIGGALLLLIVIGIVVLIARRRQAPPPIESDMILPEPPPPTMVPPAPIAMAPPPPATATYPPPPPPAGAAATRNINVPAGGMSSSEGAVSRAPAKTEVLGASTATAMAWLIIKQGTHAGKEFRLGTSTTIGRDSEHCEITLDDNAISGQHAKVKLEDDQYYLWDLASTNGTFIRTADGKEERIQKHPLTDGTEARLGSTILVFKQIK